MDSPVVRYTNQEIDFDELIALSPVEDVMAVTSLNYDTNLVTKEYLANHVNNRRAFVLSGFSETAAELEEAVLVNPNRQINSMRDHLRTHDSHA